MIERTFVVRDPKTGVMLKIRPDLAVAPCEWFPNGFVLDPKSTTDASPKAFARQVWNNDYGLQATLYPRVLQLLWGTASRPPFGWLAQEKTRPFVAKCYLTQAGDSTGYVGDDGELVMDGGPSLTDYWDARIDAALVRVAECEATGIWPAYGDDPADLELPAWAHAQMDAGVEL